MGKLYIDNTNSVFLIGLTNKMTQTTIERALVTMSLLDKQGETVIDSVEMFPIVGQPINVPGYEIAPPGTYHGIIPNTTPLVNAVYYIQVRARSPDLSEALFLVEIPAVYRGLQVSC